jgi:hypothetical protein
MMSSSRPLWRKSTYSNGQASCVEAASQPGTVGIRDSKNPDGPRLAIPAAGWRAFIRTLKDGPAG